MSTVALKVSYDGAAYSGFAKQRDEDVRTVQGCLEEALAVLYRREVGLVCAGRTDAGVHARGQVVSFELGEDELAARDGGKLLISLNALTPDDISVMAAYRASDGFSARFDAERREYRYRICTGPIPPLFLRDFAWWHKGALDVDAMREAAACLVGEHDFKSFCKAASAEGKTTMRCIEALELFEEEHLGERCLTVRVVGNAFLHSMVRTIVGSLCEVGSGRRESAWMREALKACDREAAGPTAPACGLTFWQVDYPDGALQPLA